ncbi:MAG: hypothetical protein Q4C89_02180 [Deinococcus sp.]|uniref:hypothetical protein n=1 Tax=Deinococcus sp. TaxID=47478 RepID=UPI0026DC6178|nr:hypothetical protein [Deinococcus sp.]MDO4244814.1 hypothetical protein [Deinococcus sp.]
MTSRTASVLGEVLQERERQQAKWGEQDHDPAVWLMILGEEVGEVNNAALEHLMGNLPDLSAYREELIQVAAVVVQAVENLDKRAEGERD